MVYHEILLPDGRIRRVIDRRSDAARRGDRQWAAELKVRLASLIPEDADERAEALRLCAAARQAFESELTPAQRRALVFAASRSYVLLAQVTIGDWAGAAESLRRMANTPAFNRQGSLTELAVQLQIHATNGLDNRLTKAA
jgi:hypothetical protein